MEKAKAYLKIFGEGILMSYAQIFFSNSRVFAVILLISSFFDPFAGLSGLIALVISQLAAWAFGYNLELVRNGTYSYNSLMVGLVMGIYFSFNPSFFLMLVLVSLLTFFLTIWLANITSRHAVPFLSFPFLVGTWITLLSARGFQSIELNDRGIYTITELIWGGDNVLHQGFDYLNNLPLPEFWVIYFKSMGAILFQFNLVSGILIAIGLLIYSRQAFSLSLLGYSIGYLFYYFFEGNFSELIYSYIGFNFILAAIALGGFFVVPSWKSYLLVGITIPLIAVLISALGIIFTGYNLPLYSLPFNLLVVLLLLSLNLRVQAKGLDKVIFQQFSPEMNHYKHFIHKERFKSNTWFHIRLPFFGEWRVSQGIDGNITHKGEWGEAWDFDVVDDEGNTWREPGASLTDFYSYDLPVIAPAGGTVVEVVDGVKDNEIGDVNTEENWGNAVVIQHGDYLYSKLAHLKKGSIKVKKGDYVRVGEVIGNLGNSGRSPEPHIHFQLQATPFIGSKTLKYPISFFISEDENGELAFNSFDYPKEGHKIRNIQSTPVIKDAFHLIPGKTFEFRVKQEGKESYELKWEIFTDSLNSSYIWCHKTRSMARFVNNGTLFYFTDFNGKKGTLLHYFYLAAQKVLLGYYPGVELEDRLLPQGFFNPILMAVQDVVAPFGHFLKVKYKMKFGQVDDTHAPRELQLVTRAEALAGSKVMQAFEFQFRLADGAIQEFSIEHKKQSIKAICTNA